MEAMRFHEYGDADVLRDEDVEVPVPGPDEVRIRVAATAFNPVDAGIRGGYLQAAFPVALPHVPGIDVAGTIDALGASVTGRRAGDRVIAFLPMIADGSAAEYVVAPAEILAEAPANIPLADAAALPSVGLAAWQSLFEHAESPRRAAPARSRRRRSRRRLRRPARQARRRARDRHGQPSQRRAGPRGGRR